MNLIDKDALLGAIDKERQILIEQERLGAEHIVVHHARRLVEDAPTIDAIPVEWLNERHRKACGEADTDLMDAITVLCNEYHVWQKEQGVR